MTSVTNLDSQVDSFFEDFFFTEPDLVPKSDEELAAAMQAQVDYNNDLRAAERLQSAKDLKAEWRALCGKIFTRSIDAASGKLHPSASYCHQWRDRACLRCYDHRLVQHRSETHSAALDARKDDNRLLHGITLSAHEANKLTRKLGRKYYKRFPGEDGMDFMIIDGAVDGSEPLSYDDISALDWDSLMNTPDGRNVSGMLGKAPDIQDPDKIRFKSPRVTLSKSTTPQQEKIAWQRTIQQTKHLNPKTKEELEVALEMRLKRYMKNIRAAGGRVLEKSYRIAYQEIQISSIAWARDIEKVSQPLTPEQLSEIPF